MKQVPFYSNTKDDLHCYQASLRMILKYFMPKKSFSFQELDKMTGQKKGKWTWPMKGVLSLKDMGFQVVDIEKFDYGKVAEDIKKYLIETYGEEAAREQIKHSDIPSVQKDAREFAQKVQVDYRLPTTKDIQNLLEDGYLVTCLVNSKALNKKKGYIGHSVVVFTSDSKSIFLHDPGLSAQKNRRVPKKLFEKAWAYPDEKAKNILAFKL